MEAEKLMNKEDIVLVKEAISIACERGFYWDALLTDLVTMNVRNCKYTVTESGVNLYFNIKGVRLVTKHRKYSLEQLFYNHSFAHFLWGDNRIVGEGYFKEVLAWQHHLMLMVVNTGHKPILSYLRDNRDSWSNV